MSVDLCRSAGRNGLFDEFIQNPPLFCQVEIQHIKNYKWSEDGKDYVGEVEIIGFFDFTSTILPLNLT